MARPQRYLIPGYIYHLTHRCHDRAFLLRFARDCKVYREWLRDGAARYKVSILGYGITSNHVHLVVCSRILGGISKLMQLVESCVAQQYNSRKGRKGAFWEDRYHCTIVDSGRYLWNCLQYVDLNMVRAGVVDEPGDWEWSGYREFMGLRKRYRVLDIGTLLEKLGYDDISEACSLYRREMESRLLPAARERNAKWTESLAVGDGNFIESLKDRFSRIQLHIGREMDSEGRSTWFLKEAQSPYV